MHNPTVDVLLNHRTIRSFRPDRIEDEKLALILRAGARAATPAEMQFYSLLVVDEPETLAKLDVCAPAAVVACIDIHRHNRWMAMYAAAPLRGTAPDLLFCFWDVAITLQNMAIAAESLGLGTLTVIREMSGLFDLPEGVYPAGVLGIGYANEDPKLRWRFPMEAIVHHGAYRRPTDEQLESWYEPMNRKWDLIPRERLVALGDSSCENFAQVLSALLKRETGWIGKNLQGTGFDAAHSGEPI